LLLLGCGIAINPRADSESHFLGGCATSCAPGLSCLCGVCTEPCVEASDCSGAALGAVCRALDAAQCGREETAVCDVACALDDDCALVPGASCSSGWCRSPDPSGAVGVGPSVDENGGVQALAPDEEDSDRMPVALNTSELPAQPDLNEYVWPPCYVNPAVTIADQAALARYEGCEDIHGDLEIAFAADLRPLHALRNVFGSLSVRPLVSTQRSLEGLEGLELVQGDLRLSSLEVASLASLARLIAVGARPGQGLLIEASPTLHDLTGLEQLTNLHNLSISGAADLVSIAALQLPSVMERVVLANVPRLTSIESLSSVKRFDSLTLRATGLESLGLSSTPSIEQLSLTDNALLTDTSALLAVQFLRQLQIQGNARLTEIVFPRQVSSLESLSVADNPQLGTLTLFTLESLRELAVMRNSSLTSISLPLLALPVQTLIVVSNASLPPDSLGALAQGVTKVKIAGNQGDATGLSPCPFGRDGYCDEPPTDTLCAPNTDRFDCSAAR